MGSFFTPAGSDHAKEEEEEEEEKDGGATPNRVLAVTYGLGTTRPSRAFDCEGRAITVELEDLFVVNLYVKNSGQKLENLDTRCEQWDLDLRAYVAELQAIKPVVVTGDLNVAHRDGDVHNPDAPHLKKTPGCTARERDGFSTWLEELDQVDGKLYLFSVFQCL
jgi:exodeoxyribonuclease III